MTDKETQVLLERLRKLAGAHHMESDAATEAADKIEALERSLAQKDEALRQIKLWSSPRSSIYLKADAALTPKAADEQESK